MEKVEECYQGSQHERVHDDLDVMNCPLPYAIQETTEQTTA